jgi:PKD repeat protein
MKLLFQTKSFFLSVLLLVTTVLFAQQPITITTSDMPVAGNNIVSAIDTIPSGLNPGPKGANLLWDFSTLTANDLDTGKWVTPASTPYNSTFGSNSNLAVTNNDTNYIFFSNSASAMKTTGAALWIDTIGSAVATTFTGTNNLYVFPTTYNGTHTNSYGFVQNVTIGTTPIEVDFSATYFDTIDAWGIVRTPYGYYEALRQKRVERNHTVVTAFSVLPVSNTRDTTTDYNFLAKETKQALIDFQYDSNGVVTRIGYSTILPKPIARYTYTNSGGTYTFTNTTYNTNGTTYVWDFGDGSPTSNGTSPNHTYSANGNYNVCVTATNAQGSSTYCQTVNVTGACPTIVPNITTTSAACGQATGSATAAPTGGATPYDYDWSNSATTASITNVAAGAYTVTITDNNSCSVVATANVSNTGAPTVSETHVDASCYDVCDGIINVAVSGGILPYSYLWSEGSTTEDIGNLCAGTYSFTVTDSSNCSAVISVDIAQPDSLNITAVVTDESSSGAADGAIDLTVTGGTSPFDYVWSEGSTTEDLTAVSCGPYAVQVTDDNGCAKAAAFDVDCPVSVADFSDASSINIYPNPTSGKIFIQLAGNSTLKIEVLNALGENIISKTLTADGEIDLSAHAKGIYFIRANYGEQSFIKRIVLE